MSFSLTYDGLVSDMKTWAEDTDSEYQAEIPDMIARAETRVLRDLSLQHFEGWENITISALDQFVDKPTDAVAIHEIWYKQGTTWSYALKRTQSFCRAYWAVGSGSSSNNPEYFAEVGDDETDGIFIVPNPSATYSSGNAKFKKQVGLTRNRVTAQVVTLV